MGDIFEIEYIKDAAALLYYVDNIHFSPSFAIFAITQDSSLANDGRWKKATRLLREKMDLNVTRTKDLKEITYEIMKAKALPRLNNTKCLSDITFADFRTKKISDAMRLAGYNHEDTIGSGAKYKSCLRYCSKKDTQTDDRDKQQPLQPPTSRPTQIIDVEEEFKLSVPTLSPVSLPQCSYSLSLLSSKPKSSTTS